jgi:hypothetical protein
MKIQKQHASLRLRRRRIAPPPARAAVDAWEGRGDGGKQRNDADETSSEDTEDARQAKVGWDVAMSRVTLLQLATCAATGIAEPLLGSIDTFWVATLGTTALAALGPNTCVYSSVIAVVAAHGLGTAATRVIAVALEQDEAAAAKMEKQKSAHNDGGGETAAAAATAAAPPPPPVTTTRAGASMVAVVATALAFGLACAAVLLVAPRAVVALVGAPEQVVGPAAGYLLVRAFGVPAVCLIAVLGGAFQAARDARTPFLAVLVAGAANLVLDPLCIFTLGMGFNGAATATVIAQYASATLMAWFAFCGPRRGQFFGGGGGAAAAGAGSADGSTAAAGPTTSSNNILSAYSFDPALAWMFAKEVGSMMGRVLNVVAVWGATSVCATRLGVDEAGLHSRSMQFDP